MSKHCGSPLCPICNKINLGETIKNITSLPILEMGKSLMKYSSDAKKLFTKSPEPDDEKIDMARLIQNGALKQKTKPLKKELTREQIDLENLELEKRLKKLISPEPEQKVSARRQLVRN